MKKIIAAALLVLLLLTACAEPLQGPCWLMEKGGRYFLDEEGNKVTGWLVVDGATYYFDEWGLQRSGWQEVDGKRYYLLPTGVCTGWQEVGGKRYYFTADGTPATGWLTVDGVRYYLDENGNPLSGWLTLEGYTYLLQQDGAVITGWQEVDGKRCFFDKDGRMLTGWQEMDGKRCYFGEDGALRTGRQTIDGDTYLFGDDGSVYTGWLETDGELYYYMPDGAMAVGQVEIDGRNRFFTSAGKHTIMVNPWNTVPEDYERDLVKVEGWHEIQAEAAEEFEQMITDCKRAGHGVYINCIYRSNATQQFLYYRKVNYYRSQGNDYTQACTLAGRSIAVPGTSEHELGLAADIVDSAYQRLDWNQANMPTQKWLMENSWKYGFTLRYPDGKSEVTGIIYEPWHYRYVGKELAKELYELDLCMEEYFAMLTQQRIERHGQ